MAEFSEASETTFQKLLSKLVSSKAIAPTVADKFGYHKFIIMTVKERKIEL